MVAQPSDSIKYFDSNYLDYLKDSGNKPDFIERYIIWSYLIDKYFQNQPILMDIGCGNGIITGMLCSKGYTIGVDGSSNMIEAAKDYLIINNYSNFDLSEINLPFPDDFLEKYSAKIGLAAMSSVLEYIEDDAVLIKQIYELLTDDGIFIVSVPNAYSLYRKFEFQILKRINKKSYLKYVNKIYTLNEFLSLARDIGFEPVEHIYFAIPNFRILHSIYGKKRPKHIANLCAFVFRKIKR